MKNSCLFILAISFLGHNDAVNSDMNNIVNRNGVSVDHTPNIPILTDRDSPGNLNRELDEEYMRLFKREGIRNYRIDDGNPDIHGRIERPCQVYDMFCIRKYVASHSRCKISGRPVPEPLFRAQLTVNFVLSNISATQVNVEYRGLKDARVEEFYINKATDNLVLTLNFPLISVTSNDTNLKFYTRGREPVVTRGFGNIYVSLAATVIIPQLHDLRLDRAEITADANVPVQPFIIGPGVATSTDPEVLAMLPVFLANAAREQMEGILTEAPFYAATFIQYTICDFGLKVL